MKYVVYSTFYPQCCQYSFKEGEILKLEEERHWYLYVSTIEGWCHIVKKTTLLRNCLPLNEEDLG